MNRPCMRQPWTFIRICEFFTVCQQQHLSDVVFIALVGFSLYGKWRNYRSSALDSDFFWRKTRLLLFARLLTLLISLLTKYSDDYYILVTHRGLFCCPWNLGLRPKKVLSYYGGATSSCPGFSPKVTLHLPYSRGKPLKTSAGRLPMKVVRPVIDSNGYHSPNEVSKIVQYVRNGQGRKG